MKTFVALLFALSFCAFADEVRLSDGVDEIVKLSQSQVTADIIKGFIHKSTLVYDLTADEIIHLRKSGVADEIVTTMLKHAAGFRSGAAANAAVAATSSTAVFSTSAPVAPAQTSVIAQPDPRVIATSVYSSPLVAPPVVYSSSYCPAPSSVYYPESEFYLRFGTPSFPWHSLRYSYPHYGPRFSIGYGFGFGGGYHGGFHGHCR